MRGESGGGRERGFSLQPDPLFGWGGVTGSRSPDPPGAQRRQGCGAEELEVSKCAGLLGIMLVSTAILRLRMVAVLVLVPLLLILGSVRPAAACKVVVFRHIEKAGGTAIRMYFGLYRSKYKCSGQFCQYQGIKLVQPSTAEMVERIDSMVTKNPFAQDGEDGLFLEVHQSSTVDFERILDALDRVREKGCKTTAFILLRNIVPHAFSDFKYFYKEYSQKLNNLDLTFSEFVQAYPENLIRRIARNYQVEYAYRENYLGNSTIQLELYQNVRKYLSRFDVIGLMDDFSSFWEYMCTVTDLNDAQIDPAGLEFLVGEEHIGAINNCKDLSHHIRALAGKHFTNKTMDCDEDFVKQHNPVSSRIWEEAKVREETLYTFSSVKI